MADEVEDTAVDGEDADEKKEVEDANVTQYLLRWYGTRRLGAYSHPPINLEAQVHLPRWSQLRWVMPHPQSNGTQIGMLVSRVVLM